MTPQQAVIGVLTLIQSEMRDTLKKQGHYNTGKLSDSISYRITVKGDAIVGVIEAPDYAVYLDTGVPASRIPYSGRRGGGGTSQYIQGLITYFRDRGLPSREAKSAAFATAEKQRREGMPTRDSFRFSDTGRRTGFIKESVDSSIDRATDALEESFREIIILELKESAGKLEYVTFE